MKIQSKTWLPILILLILLIVLLVFGVIGLSNGATEGTLFRELLTIILVIAGVAIAAGGYLVYRLLEALNERRTERTYREAQKADETLRLRTLSHLYIHSGYTCWNFYKGTKQALYLEQAISDTETARNRYADNLDEQERENQKTICIIRNNLAYYYAERKRLEDKKIARDYAEYIYSKIIEFPERRLSWEDTYDFVRRQYP